MPRARSAAGVDARPEPVVCELGSRGKLLVAEAYFEPRTPIVIDKKSAGDAAVGDLVVVSTQAKRARIEEVLGSARLIEVVLAGLLVQSGVRPAGGRAGDVVMEGDQLPAEPAGNEDGRVDLRALPTFTIDPDDARDFDDAISIQREGDGA